MDLSPLYPGLCTRRALEACTWLFQIRWIWYIFTNSFRSIFWIQKIFCLMMRWLSYLGILVSTYDMSAMCQDPNLFLPEADSKDPVVPVCHHHTPAIGYLANQAPWWCQAIAFSHGLWHLPPQMKLSDVKSCRKKDPKGKKKCHYELGISWLGVRILLLSI